VVDHCNLDGPDSNFHAAQFQNFIGQRKKGNLTVSTRISLMLILFALVAFVAWAAALPGTPFLSLTPRATAIGGWAVVILALVMYKVADLLDVVLKG
jgi:hypothetical protein